MKTRQPRGSRKEGDAPAPPPGDGESTADLELRALVGADPGVVPMAEVYRLVVENSRDLIVLVDRQANIVFASPSFRTILGYSLEEVLGRPGLALVHPDDVETAASAISETLSKGTSTLSEIRVRHRNGDWVRMEAAGTAIRDEAGEPNLILAVVRDVTERTRIREELVIQKSMLEAQSEASLDGILVVSNGGKIVSFNQRFVQLWGIPTEVIAARSDQAALAHVSDLLVDPEDFLARVADLNRQPEAQSRDEIRLKDGRVFDRFSGPVKGPDGQAYGRVWSFRDVTEERRREEDRLALLANERAVRARTEAAAAQVSFLDAANRVLSDPLDSSMLTKATRLAVPFLADWATAFVVDEGGSLQRVAIADIDPERERLIEEGWERFPPEANPNHTVMQAIRTGQPVLKRTVGDRELAQMASGKAHTDALRRLGLASNIVVPLVARTKTLGALSLSRTRTSPRYTEDDLAIASEFAQRVALALDNANLYARERAARAGAEAVQRRLTVQYSIASVLAESETIQEAAARLLRSVCENLGWDLGALWRVDPAAEVLRCIDVWRSPLFHAPRFEEATRTRTFQMGVGLPGRAWEMGEPMWIEDVVTDTNFPRAPLAAAEGIHGAFAFPVILGEERLGVIEFFSREARETDQELLRTIAAMGSQIGQFIQRREAELELTRLFDLERAARAEADAVSARLRRLQWITDAAHTRRTLDELLPDLLGAVKDVLGTDSATMLLLTEDGKNLAVRAVAGDEEEARGQVRVPFGKGIAGKVAALREPAIVDDVPHAGPYSGFLKKRVKSMILVPLEVGDRVIGVIHAATFDKRRFTQDELQLLRVVAERAAVAVENARLYDAEQAAMATAEAARTRLGFLAEAGAILGGSLNLDEALESLAGLAVSFLTDICLIDLLSEDGTIQRVAARHADPAKQELTTELQRTFAPDPAGSHPAVEVMKTGQSKYSAFMPEDFLRSTSRNDEHFEIIRKLGFQSYISVPLTVGDRALGALTLVSTDPERRYGPVDVSLAEDLARRAAMAVENARLYESEQEARLAAQRAASRTLVLQAITAALSEAVTSSDVAAVVLKRGFPVLKATAGSICELVDSGRELAVIGGQGYSESLAAEWRRIPIDAPVPLAEAVRTGESIVIWSREERAERYPELASTGDPANQAWAAVPMVVEGRVVGALGMSFDTAEHLGQDELGFMLALARQGGQALVRTRLYESEQIARREAEAARSQLQFLAEASDLFSMSLDSQIVLDSITKLVVPQLADWCVVDLLDDDQTIRQTAVAHVEPSMETVARELRKRYPPDHEHSVWRVLTTGEPELAEVITQDDLQRRARDQLHLRLLNQLGIRSHMVVPLRARGRTLGAVSFVSGSRSYGRDDLALAEQLVIRASLAVDNARLYQQQLHVARTLQESLLPQGSLAIPGLEVAVRYQAAGEGTEVGGDFYDVFEAREGAWALVIGDVCGKGPEAAAVTGLARHTIRATTLHEDRPSQILARLNEAIYRQVADNRFCTVCYARVRASDGGARVTVSSGGHPLPLVMRVGGTLETVGRPGRLLGVFPDTELSDQIVDLGPGDSIILYTDGVTEESSHGVHFGMERLGTAIQSCAGQGAESIAEGIVKAVAAFRPERPRDDVALVVLRIPPRDAAN